MILSLRIPLVSRFRLPLGAIFAFILALITVFSGIQYFATRQVVEQVVKKTVTVQSVIDLGNEIFVSGKVAETLKDLALEASLKAKLIEELERILAKTYPCNQGVVYFLRANNPNYYPILGYGDKVIGSVYLKQYDVWKVGQTSLCEQDRYPKSKYYESKDGKILLTGDDLQYLVVFSGDLPKVLAMERLFIYTYPL